MSAIFVFIVGIMFINFIMPEVSTTRIDLNCADAENISDGTKLLCLVVGVTIPYWIILIFSIAMGFIIARIYT